MTFGMMETELAQESYADAVIAGAGIIGLSIAWELAREGVRVRILDAGAAASEASWAGAGMLTAGSELRRRDPWLPLGIEGSRQYPEFVHRLEAQTGCSIDYRRAGTLELAGSEEEFARMRRLASRQLGQGLAVEVVEASDIARLGPALAAPSLGGLFYPDDAAVDPRHISQALLRAVIAEGAIVEEHCRVEAIEAGEQSCRVETDTGSWTTGCAVIACGAWSSSITVRHAVKPVRLPRVTPVKGHLIGFDCEPGLLGPMVRQGSLYLLQRQNGFLIAGSNEERSGFDRTVNPGIVEHLTEGAAKLLPVLAERKPSQAWIGFRPAVRRTAFPVNQWVAPTVCLAYGHFRNGILMAPSTAARVAEELRQRLAPRAVTEILHPQ